MAVESVETVLEALTVDTGLRPNLRIQCRR